MTSAPPEEPTGGPGRGRGAARDRAAPPGETDPVLGGLDASDFDELWLFAVDTGEGLNGDECGAISRFRKRGGGLMVSRDHQDLGSSVCTLGGVGEAHFFHSRNPEPDESRRAIDDPYTTDISWPNYHSGANGDFQAVQLQGDPHPVFTGVTLLPAHPHEGAVGAPPADPSARDRHRPQQGHRPSVQPGRGLRARRSRRGGDRAEHVPPLRDYNLDPALGAPSFVSEPPGDGFAREPSALAETHRYFDNVARWLAARPV